VHRLADLPDGAAAIGPGEDDSVEAGLAGAFKPADAAAPDREQEFERVDGVDRVLAGADDVGGERFADRVGQPFAQGDRLIGETK